MVNIEWMQEERTHSLQSSPLLHLGHTQKEYMGGGDREFLKEFIPFPTILKSQNKVKSTSTSFHSFPLPPLTPLPFSSPPHHNIQTKGWYRNIDNDFHLEIGHVNQHQNPASTYHQ